MSFDKPPIFVEFSVEEKAQMQKTLQEIQKIFLSNHPEITVPTTSDLTSMIRQEKLVYSNLAIAFTIQFLAAVEKKKSI